ncbi:hypothetical protein [Clostridium sp. CF012]|uniref:hypothetical protein n=1 Tax=Clostridium sp. CF012 TaxID=2843319 RepID=UPI001C0B75E4|nr:hypothetical protein [Clostridium sp. CF012]MBU3146990.1 hypothetical protein [Clostridium sp. CF012]
MSIKETLNKIRAEQSAPLTIKQIILKVLVIFALGMFLGFIAKYSDTIPSNGLMGSVWHTVSNITTRLGIWVLLATIIAAWSNNPRIGAIKVFAFFSGMLLVYYIYSMRLFGFFPTYYFIRWGGIALASPIAAYIVWFSRGNGWIAALCASMPIGLLVSQGYPFFYMFTMTLGFDIFSAIILFLILPMNKKQWLRIFMLTLLIVFILRNSRVLSYIFGGL